jgi:hypothetical protein
MYSISAKETNIKINVYFPLWQSTQSSRNLPSSSKMVPEMLLNCVSLRKKKQGGEYWQFAQWLCDHWHNAAVTARYANELEAVSYQYPPDLENLFLRR